MVSAASPSPASRQASVTMDIHAASLPQLAAWIADHLERRAIQVILSGGACVSIYTDRRDISYDLDFVLLVQEKRSRLREAMSEIGFSPEGRHFRHPETPFIVEFLSPPLSVGAEPVKEISTLQEGGRTLSLLSPTDCVKDRLAAFYHWGDRPSLEQAVLVCRARKVNLDEVRRWSRSEGMEEKYREFRKELRRTRAAAE